jgi:hypothetical protein
MIGRRCGTPTAVSTVPKDVDDVGNWNNVYINGGPGKGQAQKTWSAVVRIVAKWNLRTFRTMALHYFE